MDANKNIMTFKDLKVWQKGIELVKEIYRVTETFPKQEQYSLSAQMRRSAISIPSNIAEGFRRRHSKEHKQFLNITLGSCAELETQLVIAKELNYLEERNYNSLLELIDHICRMSVNLNKTL